LPLGARVADEAAGGAEALAGVGVADADATLAGGFGEGAGFSSQLSHPASSISGKASSRTVDRT
jgi:hypothetical protein